MKHALVVSHPRQESFTLAMAGAYADEVRAQGDEVIVRDLYRLGFDPVLKSAELTALSAAAAAPDVRAEREAVGDADVFVFVYPVWFNAPPAMTVGYIDRILGMGFGFGTGPGGNAPLLGGKRLLAFSSSGAPDEWFQNTGAYEALKRTFDEHVAEVCGLAFLEHVHFGGIVPHIRPDAVETCLEMVRRTVRKHFGHPSQTPSAFAGDLDQGRLTLVSPG